MKYLKTSGVVIAESSMEDYDKMLTVLTPNMGKISCIARGAKKNNSPLMAGTQYLCFSDFNLYKTKDTYSINSCETIEVFYNIRTDLDKLTVASFVTKIINDVTTENQGSFNTLKLYLNTLYMISETDKDLDFIVSVFKLRLLKILGFMPNVSECVECKSKEKIAYFSIKDDGVKCKKCGKLDKGAIQISEATLNAMKYILGADSKKIFNFSIPKECEKELEIVTSLYLNEKLEKEYKIEKIV